MAEELTLEDIRANVLDDINLLSAFWNKNPDIYNRWIKYYKKHKKT